MPVNLVCLPTNCKMVMKESSNARTGSTSDVSLLIMLHNSAALTVSIDDDKISWIFSAQWQ